jgi:hypothetical protein
MTSGAILDSNSHETEIELIEAVPLSSQTWKSVKGLAVTAAGNSIESLETSAQKIKT